MTGKEAFVQCVTLTTSIKDSVDCNRLVRIGSSGGDLREPSRCPLEQQL